MPYSGPDDPSLPSNVRKLSATRRRQWLHVYNSYRGRGSSDGEAIHIANGVVKESEMDDKETKQVGFVDYEAKADGSQGIVTGYASVFGDRDTGGDKTYPGAFTKSLSTRGNQVVYIPAHDYKIHVGQIPAVPLQIQEDSKGLLTETRFLLNTQAGKDSFEVIKAYQEAGRPLGLSYTYKVIDYDRVREGRDLKQLELFEYGHCALPMLESARTTGTKSDSNAMRHSESVDHAHSHGDMIHSHPHVHEGDAYYSMRHDYHDHTADQMKSLVPDFEWESKQHYKEDEVKEFISKGHALEDGTFIITNEDELKDAIKGLNAAKDLYSARRHIRRRAKELGLESLLPSDWASQKFSILMLHGIDEHDAALLEEFEGKLGRAVTEEGKQAISAALAAVQTALTQEEARTEEDLNRKSDDDIRLEREKRELEEALALINV